MPAFTDHPDLQCDRCGYNFRKNDRYLLDDGKTICESEKNCRRRQRVPKPEYANPDATVDEMIDKIATQLSADVRDIMLAVSENEDWLRYCYRACYDPRPLVRVWR